MNDDQLNEPEVEVLRRTVLADDWGVLTKYDLSYKRRDGSTQAITRETYDRGHGATILLYHPERGAILLTEQFRLPAFVTGHSGQLIEACAGLLDERDPETAIRQEAEEETGVRVGQVERVGAYFMSPGSVTERLHFFVAPYCDDMQVGPGGGVRTEGEDIRILEISLDEALAMIGRGEIIDAKTIILIQHLIISRLCPEQAQYFR